ncbi:MAG: hypothetical protein ACYCV7_07490 [Acidimicrobiales bacterium]
MDTLDIIRQLETDPGLRTQLRAVLLTEEILQLPHLVAENSRDIRDLKEVVAENSRDIRDLKEVVASLVQGQASLERGQASLERGQASLERGQASLERGQESLRKEVGRLSAVVGGTVEDDASSVVVTVLERRGWTVHGSPQPVEVNGEIDVLGRATTAEGADVGLFVEAKTRLRPADVRRFAAGLDALAAESGIEGAYVPYVYGLRVYTGVAEAATELGLGVLCPDGERVPGSLRAAPAPH